MVSKVMAVDLGYGWVKALMAGKAWRQPSVLGELKQLHEMNYRENDIIFNQEYFVGDLAVRHSEVRYAGMKDSKAETWTTEILLKVALGMLAPQNGIYLVTGLPIDFYFNQKEAMQNMIERVSRSGSYTLKAGSCNVTAWPNIRQSKIVPQPLGAAMDFILDDQGQLVDREAARKKILVVDLGFYTLDLLILDGMEIHKASCSPPGLGISTAYKLLRQYLTEKIGKAPAMYELDRYVLEGEYEGYNITPLIQKAFKALADQVQLEVDSLNMNFYAAIVTGGQAGLLADFLQVDNKVVSDQLGNVRGYEKIGKRTWRER